MGVPAFFRWLSKKYPSIVVHCIEEKAKSANGVVAPIDTSDPNPNDIEFDNLYLDMNGIIHPCCHPEDKPEPKNEDEMMVLIFEYIDRLFAIVRPRRLLYMAIDGVAPRAKMNQQRSRRFRAAKESCDKKEAIERVREEIFSKGGTLPERDPNKQHFDSNCITPGTEFMHRLSICLRYYIRDRLENDRGWAKIKVVLSDANAPGEGEHKIMDYIRHQRAQSDHDPNTHHCLCGADADLIMLGLATHEAHFTIIREEFKPNKARPCDLCGQVGHELKDCEGLPKQKSGEFDHVSEPYGSEQEFIFLRLNVLREYLERELLMHGLPFPYDFERALDDWVFMCFFVGNDFLPHLPSLEIREGAIDRLVRLYKQVVYRTGGYITENGVVNLSRVQLVLSELGKVEDEIFKNRRQNELQFRERNKQRKRQKMMHDSPAPRWMMDGQYAPQAVGAGPNPISNPRQTAYEMRKNTMGGGRDGANFTTAASLKAGLGGPSDDSQKGKKRKSEGGANEDSDSEPDDEVKLWEDGWKDRYYESKFGVSPDDIAFRHQVGKEYVIGLCWVLRYYYQGCASWKWYFPYHYAPFASDFVNISELSNEFEMDTQPFKPLEQLMGVFPAASKEFLPPTWQELMTSCDSPIIDFYPINFKIDLNGKKFAWQGVALLPFVNEKRLLKALAEVYPNLTAAERERNQRGPDRLFVGYRNTAYGFLKSLCEDGGMDDEIELDASLTMGVRGLVKVDKQAAPVGGTVKSPLPSCSDLHNNKVVCVQYRDPQYERGYIFPAKLLKGTNFPPRALKPNDRIGGAPGGYRPQLGFTRDSGYRTNKNPMPMLRHVRAGLGYSGGGQYGSQCRDTYSNDWRSQNQHAQPLMSVPPRGHWQGQQGGYSNYNQRGGYQQGGYQQRDYQQGGQRGRGLESYSTSEQGRGCESYRSNQRGSSDQYNDSRGYNNYSGRGQYRGNQRHY